MIIINTADVFPPSLPLVAFVGGAPPSLFKKAGAGDVAADGTFVGVVVGGNGVKVGELVMRGIVSRVGVLVGVAVGVGVGTAVGAAVRAVVGATVGADVGMYVGRDVGDKVGHVYVNLPGTSNVRSIPELKDKRTAPSPPPGAE